MDKNEAIRTLNHITYLIQYTVDSIADDVSPYQNINKYYKLLDSIALHIDLVKEHVGNRINQENQKKISYKCDDSRVFVEQIS